MYDDYDDEQFLGAESIVTLPEIADGDEGRAFEALEALGQNAWARHAWRENERAYERLLQELPVEDELPRRGVLNQKLHGLAVS